MTDALARRKFYLGRVEAYNLAARRTENHNLAARMGRVAMCHWRMAKMLTRTMQEGVET